ncbi:iron-sulfur cluster assembly scaffold protein [Nostocales cyanobacterium LEGE 12452]|nr:iron-sulfur cluster assembly scaffold protein [Nostocales cyanobacterium LEGE 12452]
MYNDIIIKNFSEPEHSGEIQNPHLEFEVGNSVCGDRIRVQIVIDGEKIVKGLFRAWGCATSVATANIFCSLINGNTIEKIVTRDKSELEKMLGELEPSQYHCLDILYELHSQLKISVEEVN